MSEKEIVRLKRFLKENHAYAAYIANVRRHCGRQNHNIHAYLKVIRFQDAICVAFSWSRTPQGYEYWARMDNKYCKNMLLTFFNIKNLDTSEKWPTFAPRNQDIVSKCKKNFNRRKNEQ